jgi:hypothetical protein
LTGLHPPSPWLSKDATPAIAQIERELKAYCALDTEAMERVFSQLQTLGFDDRREPVVCGEAVIRDHT